MAVAVLAALSLGRCGALPEDGGLPEDPCAESGYYPVGNQFISPDGLHVCVCELDGSLVCRRSAADAGPIQAAALAKDREQSNAATDTGP